MHRSLTIFVVMPFDKTFRDVYELAVKPACIEAGAQCERVDEQLFLENILDRIYRQIRAADLIIGEMTGRNANVFYEIGYAHGLGKPVILVTRRADDIPFDLKHYPHIVYEGSIADLKRQLHKKVRWCVENPAQLLGPRDRTNEQELERMGVEIESYLTANGYTKISFERLTSAMKYSEDRVRALIQHSPGKFRFAILKGDLPGIALIGRFRGK